MSMDLTDDKSTLVQVMAWCRSTSSYGVTKPQWLNWEYKQILYDFTLIHFSELHLIILKQWLTMIEEKGFYLCVMDVISPGSGYNGYTGDLHKARLIILCLAMMPSRLTTLIVYYTNYLIRCFFAITTYFHLCFHKFTLRHGNCFLLLYKIRYV